ncbi:MAG: hydrogenase maturation protease [Streptosporangiales bacterium]|nr:hydrogenase maturation protease [Streptosporangiales bacterium]
MLTGRTLVAGVGNVFSGDDGFGPEVARELARRPAPDGVEIGDFGTGGVHLVYELLDGCDLFVLVDAAQRGREPGTVTVVEVDPGETEAEAPAMDGHGLTPEQIFAMLAALGGRPGRSLLVACEPAELGPGMELSDPVRAAVPYAVRAVEDIIRFGEGTDDAAHDHHGGSGGGTGRRDRVLPAGREALRGTQPHVAARHDPGSFLHRVP